MKIILILSILTFLISIILLLVNYIFKNNNKLSLTPFFHHNYFSIVIPSRYESAVLENLLISIENQSLRVNSQDVYVILVKDDYKDIEIVNRHHCSIIFRTDLTKQRKGNALDEAFQSIYNN